MSELAVAQRMGPLDGRAFARDGVSLTPAAAATRLSLRVRDEAQAEAKKLLGFALPQKPKSSAAKGDVHCLWIGPDEWLVIAADGSPLLDKFARAGNAKLSAVDVSHRNTAILIEGAKAVDTLNSGCPQDLSLAAFPVGAASRTLLGKSEIILYRSGETAFRVECWRSFSDYVWTYLVDAARSA
ncbi:MAG: sarcosine oxidase subunit gamma [Nitratireductor sp.]|nr:sarcosine oxidase subunit gamma [Nitratireductor sp.]